MKVKFFKDSDLDFIESQINTWLSIHELDEILNISYHVDTHKYSVMITYEEWREN